MIEFAVEFLTKLPWYYVIIFAFIITFIENIFPPSPSDTILIFCGTLVGINVVDFPSLLISSTIGSVLGFLLLFWLGWVFGIKIIDSNKIKFINLKTLEKPELWFRKYGYIIIIINRFLSGTRAVISFFAGISKLAIFPSIVYSTISSLIWNFLLIYLGMVLGENWKIADYYIDLYGKILLPVMFALIILFSVIIYFRKYKKSKNIT